MFGKTGWADRYWIETSNDLQTWTRIAKRTNKPVGQWQEVLTNVQATYVRFRFDNPSGDNQLGGIAEIQVLPPGVTPLSPTPTPSPTPAPVKYTLAGGGKSLNSQTDSTSVRDGNFSTYWRTKDTGTQPIPANGNVYVYLGTKSVPIGAIRWTFATGGMADKYYIEVSSNGTNWVRLATYNGSPPLNTWQELKVTTSARYVRWWFENPNSDPVIGGVSEVEIWSAPGGYSTIPPTATPTVSGQSLPDKPTSTSTPAKTSTATPATTPTAAPTETPTPASTEVPTEIATETATAAPTDAPTETQEATEEPTIAESPTTESAAVDEQPTEPAADPTPYAARRTRRSANSVGDANVIDGDPATVWITNEQTVPNTSYVYVDLGRTQAVGSIRWLFDAELASGHYTIEISTNRSDWTPLLADGDLSPGAWQELAVGQSVRYIRFSFTNPDGVPRLGGLAEIEAWP